MTDPTGPVVESATPNRPSAAADQPLVTVVITTYNRPSYLVDAVESVRGQRYRPVELLVVDDHSETPAESVLESSSLDGLAAVECIRHSQNRGANAARNTGIRNANGEYVAFLDDDDTWNPSKLETQVAAFDQHDNVGVTYTGAKTLSDGETAVETPPQIEGDLTKALLCRNVVGTLSTVMVRTELARETPLDEEFPSWADLEWYIRLSQKTAFHRIPEPLVVYEFDSHNRLSVNLEKKRVAYRRFLHEFDALAAEHGGLFQRKMRAWAAYRLGSTALHTGNYQEARLLFLRAVRTYPFEREFLLWLLVSLGGRHTHGAARNLKGVVSPVRNIF